MDVSLHPLIFFYLILLNTFLFQNEFVFEHEIQISGVSSESLSDHCKEFSQTGTLHKRLLKFMEIPVHDLNSGCVFRTFINAIKTFLKYYHSQIITFIDSNIDNFTPISIYTQFKPYMEQIKYLFSIFVIFFNRFANY